MEPLLHIPKHIDVGRALRLHEGADGERVQAPPFGTERDRQVRLSSNNSSLSLMVTMTLCGNMASRVQGDVYFTGVHEIIALTNMPPFHHMQRPFIVKKHSALGKTFPIVVGFRVSA